MLLCSLEKPLLSSVLFSALLGELLGKCRKSSVRWLILMSESLHNPLMTKICKRTSISSFLLLGSRNNSTKDPCSLVINNVGSDLFGKFGIILCESSLPWLEGSYTGSDLMGNGPTRNERKTRLIIYTLLPPAR